MRIQRFAAYAGAALLLAACREPTIPETINLVLAPVATHTSGVVGELTDAPPSVRATRESDGRPMSGVVVEFRATGPQAGTIGARLDTTDAAGVASAGTWRLGTTAGSHTVLAFAYGYPGSVTLYATARAGAPAIVNAAVPSRQYVLNARQPFAPSVHVVDRYRNSISGLGVSFATPGDGGVLGAASATTNNNGTASSGTWTLPTTAGTYSASALAAGLPPITFNAQRVDSSALVWYALDSISQSGKVYLPVDLHIKASRLGLSKFDLCLCVPFDGPFFEIIDYEGPTSPHYEYSGSAVVAGGKLTLNGEEVLALSANTVKIKRIDYYYSLTTWIYGRKN